MSHPLLPAGTFRHFLSFLLCIFGVIGTQLVHAQSVPSPPLAVSAQPSSTSALVNWSSVSGATGYNVYEAVTGNTLVKADSSAINGTSYSASGLSSNTGYSFYVTAVDASGESSASATVTATTGSTRLTAPAQLRATPASAQVTLDWSSVTGATSYDIWRSTGGGALTLYQTGQTGTEYVDTNVTSGTSYGYAVAGVQSSGEGFLSSTFSATPGGTTLSPPTAWVVQQGSGTLTLYWDAVSGATGYHVYISTTTSFAAAPSGATTGTGYNFTGLTNGTTEYMAVAAYNSNGDGPLSAAASGVVGGSGPGTPTALTATPYDSKVSLTWSSVSGATSYCLFRYVGSNSPVLIADSLPLATSSSPCLDTGLTDGTTYNYKVCAENGDVRGNASSAASATPEPAPSAPTTLSASAGGGQIVLSWTASTTGSPTSYNVYRGTSSGGEGAVAIATVSSATTYTDTNCTPGQSYYYQVTGVNAYGEGAKSNEASALPLLAPTSLSAAPGTTQVVLTWTASAGASSYNVYEGTSANGESSTPIATGVSSTTYTATGLTGGIAYYYKVAAVNGGTVSARSNEASATPGSTPLAAPAQLRLTPGNAQVTLDWSSVTGAASYDVWRSTGANTPTLYLSGLTGTEYNDGGLTNGSIYNYAVAGVQASGEGAHSNSASAVPGSTALSPPNAWVVSQGSGNLTLYWDAVSGATGYQVYLSTSSTITGAPVAGTTANAYNFTGLTNGTTYYLGVDAYNGNGDGPLSVASGTPGGSSLGAPTGLTATPNDGSVSLYWNAVSGATSYCLYRYVGSNSATLIASNLPLPTQANPYVDSGLADGTTYNYKVCAQSGDVRGTASAAVSATPTHGPPTVSTTATANPNPVMGTTTALSVLGSDSLGESALTYTWSETSGPTSSITFSPNGTNAAKNSIVTFTAAGTYVLSVTLTDSQGGAVSSSVTVQVKQTYGGLGVSPSSVIINASDPTPSTQKFTAIIVDQFNRAFASPPTVAWSAQLGSIDSNGLYTAPGTPGTDMVTATDTSIGTGATASATITIVRHDGYWAPANSAIFNGQSSITGYLNDSCYWNNIGTHNWCSESAGTAFDSVTTVSSTAENGSGTVNSAGSLSQIWNWTPVDAGGDTAPAGVIFGCTDTAGISTYGSVPSGSTFTTTVQDGSNAVTTSGPYSLPTGYYRLIAVPAGSTSVTVQSNSMSDSGSFSLPSNDTNNDYGTMGSVVAFVSSIVTPSAAITSPSNGSSFPCDGEGVPVTVTLTPSATALAPSSILLVIDGKAPGSVSGLTPGSHTIGALVSYAVGVTALASPISVTIGPATPSIAPATATICVGQTQTYTATSVPGVDYPYATGPGGQSPPALPPTSFQWYWSVDSNQCPAQPISSAYSATSTYTTSSSLGVGTYTVYCWTLASGAPQGTAPFALGSVSLTVTPDPLAITDETIAPDPAPTGATVQFTGSAATSCATTITYSWNFGDGTAITTPTTSGTVAHTYTSPGLYPVTEIVNDGATTVTQTVNLAVYPSTIASDDFYLFPTPASIGMLPGQSGSTTIDIVPFSGFTGTVNLSLSNASAGTWIYPASMTFTGQSLPLTATLYDCDATAGTYTITVTGAKGSDTHSTTVTITVGSSP